MPQPDAKKRLIIKISMLFWVTVFMFIAGYLIYLELNPGGKIPSNQSKTAGTPNSREKNNFFLASKDPKAGNTGTQEGVIGFNPAGGTFPLNLTVQLSIDSPLKSPKGDSIVSDIYYTLDGSDPSKTTGKKYTPNTPISLPGPGPITLKARLISKIGDGYEGEVYNQVYTLQAASVSSPGIVTPPREKMPGGVVTKLELLDPQTREKIDEKLKRIIIDVEGITRVDNTVKLSLQLSISKEGEAKILGIKGLVVEPAGKKAAILSQLDQKIQGIVFTPPTRNGEPVEINAWVVFSKIAKFGEKVIIER